MSDENQNPEEEVSLDTLFDGNQNPAPKPNDSDDKGDKGGDEGEPAKPKGDDNADSDDNPNGKETEENETKVKNLFTKLSGEELSDEEKETKTQILEAYKGAGFNKDGDIVDKDGNVVRSFKDVYNDLQSEEDKFDKDGNLVDDEGNILKTKDELDAEKSVVNQIRQDLGYEFKDEDGNIKTYSDDKEGIQEFALDLAKHQASEFQKSFLESNPELVNIAKHLQLGKSLDTYNQKVDYTKIKVDELSEDAKLRYIRQSFEEKGFSKERIEATITRIKDGNDVDEELKFALDDLDKNQKAIEESRNAEYQQLMQQQQKELEDYWNDIEKGVNTGKLKGFTIPETEKKPFLDYLSKPVKDGKSQATIDSENQSTEDLLTLQFLQYKKFDLGKYIKNNARTLNSKSLKDLIARSAKIKGDSNVKGGKEVDPAKVDISLDTLLG